MTIKSITPFLWFDSCAEEAANFYVSLFPDSQITHVSRYGDTGPGPKGSVMVVAFELCGRPLLALNGGPYQKLSEAFSLFAECSEQADIDRLWDALTDKPNVCGWTKDKFGLSWQIGYERLPELLSGPKSDKVMAAVMKMTKIDIQALKDAAS
ncbi:MAG TPA: VOC family protein [Rhizomicrobium sp.]|jgi:predicted 3-demethylubiquinone-9 3-methyltransferase (glyoxalase superfamily)|nr:VOC family protein [Rhizomicrobium sp.]